MARREQPAERVARQDTFYVGQLKGIGKVYLQAVVDTYGSFGFAHRHTSKRPEGAGATSHNEVLVFYREQGVQIGALLPGNRRR